MSASDPSLTFDQWIDYVFDRPVTDEVDDKWFWHKDAAGNYLDYWDPDPAVATEYLARLFRDPGVLRRFTEEQIAEGIDFLGAGNMCSHIDLTFQPSVDRELRRAWVQSFPILYRDLFAVGCSDFVESDDQGRECRPALDWACFMLWELGATRRLYELGTAPALDYLEDSVFDALQHILEIDSIACQESALHALGHVRERHQQRVEAVIMRFLSANPRIPDELRAYAVRASQGKIN